MSEQRTRYIYREITYRLPLQTIPYARVTLKMKTQILNISIIQYLFDRIKTKTNAALCRLTMKYFRVNMCMKQF